MTTGKSYSRNPITEAIIDLRVEPMEGLTLANLERCHVGEEAKYPNKTSLKLAVGQIQLGGMGESFSHLASAEQIGFLFKSADEKQIFQAHRDGFTLNRLAPYLGWKIFRDEARRLWNVCREIARPRKVIRLAVRYINRLDFPAFGVELKDYLKTSPEVSPDMAQPLANFLMQLTIPQNDIRGTLRLTEASVPSLTANTIAVALDIDLFRADDVPEHEDEMWELFENLRRRKNDIFEACITEKTRELIY